MDTIVSAVTSRFKMCSPRAYEYASAEPHPCAANEYVVEAELRSYGFHAGRHGGVSRRFPVVRQQLSQVALLERGQAVEQVFQIGPRIVPVELG